MAPRDDQPAKFDGDWDIIESGPDPIAIEVVSFTGDEEEGTTEEDIDRA